MEDFFKIDIPVFSPQYDENTRYGWSRYKDNLWELLSTTTGGYCMYCYDSICVNGHKRGEIEHGIEKINDEKSLSDCIPNLGIACKNCNGKYKRRGEAARKLPRESINTFQQAHCKKYDCKMRYISTDYVFDGQGETPWEPDCKDYKPLNVYGATKLMGEQAVSSILDKYFIVRIAWVFGVNGKNFIKTMLNVGKTHPQVRVVSDQIGTPTYTLDLARLLVDMIETEKYGYYHATNEGGYISWYDFTCEIFKQAGYDTKVVPVTTAEYGISKAARPFNSRLDKSKLVENGFKPLPTWQDAVARYLKEIM